MISVGLAGERGAGRADGGRAYQTKVQAMGMKARTTHLPLYCSSEMSASSAGGAGTAGAGRHTLEGTVNDGGPLEGGGGLLDAGRHFGDWSGGGGGGGWVWEDVGIELQRRSTGTQTRETDWYM